MAQPWIARCVLAVVAATTVLAQSEDPSSLLEALLGNARAGVLGSATPFISQRNLTAAVLQWPGHDLAVFFYSPYGEAGKFSRQVLPLWDEVTEWHARKKTKRLAITKFSCEASLAHQQLCYDIGVRQYPTITFYGYSRLSLRRGVLRRATNYRGLALFEALRDWTVAMHWISGLQRFQYRFLQAVGWRPSDREVELQVLRERDAKLQAEFDRRLDETRAEFDRRLVEARAEIDGARAAALGRGVASAAGPARRGGDDAGGTSTTWDDILGDLARAAEAAEIAGATEQRGAESSSPLSAADGSRSGQDAAPVAA